MGRIKKSKAFTIKQPRMLDFKCLTVRNTLAYHGEELITTVKSFMICALGWSEKVRGHEKGGDPPNLKSKKQIM